MPQVSVVIPAYNAADHIEACLASVFHQHISPSPEVIVVNDGSTDATLEKLRSTTGLVCLTQSNRGPAAARNAAIAYARGAYIAFLDADDLWPEDKLQKQIDLLQRHPDAAMCFGDCRQFDGERRWPHTLFEEAGHGRCAWGEGPYVPDAYARLLRNNFITTGSVVVRRQVLEDLGGFDPSLRLVEDLELWLRIARRHPIIWSEDICLLRRRHTGNLSREAEAMSLAYLKVLQRQRDCCGMDLARWNIDLNAIVASEYREMAARSLTARRPNDATRWAWQSFTTRPNLRALWYLLLGTGQKLRFGNTPT
jgi:glycosyltransferase involved in cell wall biosynthesis